MANKGENPYFSDYVWDQDENNVRILIKLKNIEFPLAKIEKDSVYLKCVAGKEKKLYEININLFEEIVADNSSHLITNEGVLFELKKQKGCYWPRLTNVHTDPSGAHILDFCNKRSKKPKDFVDIDEDTNTEEQTSQERVTENSLETSENSILKLASYSRCLVQVNNPAIYKIIATDQSITLKDIEIIARTPNKNKVNANVFESNSPNTYGIKYIPKQVGTHILNIFVKGELTLVLLTEAYNINLIKIQEPEQCLLERPVIFTVDCSKAGEGELQVFVECTIMKLPEFCTVEKLDSGIYQATFIPIVPGDYYVTVKYNGKPIKTKFNCTFVCQVFNHFFFSYKFPKEIIFPTGGYYSFIIDEIQAPLISSENIKVRVVGPSGEFLAKAVPHIFFRNFFDVSFLLKEPGTYTIYAHVKGDPIEECRHEIKAYNSFGYSKEDTTFYIPQRREHSNNLPHLSKILVNQMATFFVNLSKIDENGNRITLDITITDPENKHVPVLMMAYGNIFVVEFTPKVLGCHILTVCYNGQVVTGTPAKIKVISNKKGKGSK